ncbi:HDOD domain-containing protein, partial [Pontibacterium sp.]|uniref:HDOD domain-containing protein n=1 Tax=Pontibacterium sp. TaxID=2036026 RepID=UPI0035673171
MPHVPALLEIEEEVRQLPFLPIVLTELMAMDKAADDYFEKMVALARKDPSLTTLILKIANSAASAASRPFQADRGA